MTYSIALAGKGGTGKTTTAGMLVKYLVEKGKTPVLAVDADANANLNEVLGFDSGETLGDAREDMKTGVATGYDQRCVYGNEASASGCGVQWL